MTEERYRPRIHETAFIHPAATVLGDVTLAKGTSVWPSASVRGDLHPITIAEYSNIQDACVLHTTDAPTVIGRYVSLGHCAVVHGAAVEDDCLIGMNATVLDGAVVGAGSLVAAGAVVTPGTVIPPESLVAGVPGKVLRTDKNLAEANRANAMAYVRLVERHLNGDFALASSQ